MNNNDVAMTNENCGAVNESCGATGNDNSVAMAKEIAGQ
jgi:hypothetical protein